MVLGMGTDQEVGENGTYPRRSPGPAPGMVSGIGPTCLGPGVRVHGGVEADAGTGQKGVDVGAAGVAPAVQFGINRAGNNKRALLSVLPQSS